MRIVAGEWRGRALAAPPGDTTRPTADRVRQALFDSLLHAPWGGRDVVEGTRVLDAFAGTGALGLEALSRGAAEATFVERDRAAIAALRANVARCGADERSKVVAGDVLVASASLHRRRRLRGPCDEASGEGFGLVFLDPPYGKGLIPRALTRLRAFGLLAPGALLVAETRRDEMLELTADALLERAHGAARVTIWREA